MTLQDKQALFVKLLAHLIDFCYANGWEFTLGDLGNQQGKKHMQNSLHGIALAADLNLFVDGEWMRGDCPQWRKLGAYWKTLNPLCAWGGDFKSKDFNHVSIKFGTKS